MKKDFYHHLFTSKGSWLGFVMGDKFFNSKVEWIGYLPFGNGNIYTLNGDYLGTISRGDRLFKLRISPHEKPIDYPGVLNDYPDTPDTPDHPGYKELTPGMEDII